MSGPTTLLTEPQVERSNKTYKLAFRIHGTCYDGQTIRIANGTCSIGSGAGCTVRLRSREIDPLHCLIVSGTAGVAVRNWSPKTRFNDEPFNDAEMTEGDRLTIGSIQLELLGDRGPETPTPTALTHAASDFENSRQSQLKSVIKDTRTVGRRRAKGLVRTLRSTRKELQDTRLQSLESAATEKTLLSQIEQLKHQVSEREQLATEAKTALKTAEHEVEALQQELAELNHKLNSKSSEFEEQQACWHAERDQLESQIESTRHEFEKIQQQLSESQAAMEFASQANEISDSWQEEREQFLTQIEESGQKLEEVTKELSTEREESQQVRDRLATLEQEQGQYFSRNTTRESEMRKTVALLDERAQEIDEANTRLNQDREAFELEQRQWECERQRIEEAIEQRREKLDDAEAALEQQAQQLHDANSESTCEASSHAPIDSQADQTNRTVVLDSHHTVPIEEPIAAQLTDEPNEPIAAEFSQVDSSYSEPIVETCERADASYAPTTEEELKFEATDDVAPESTEDVFARIGQAPVSDNCEPLDVGEPVEQASEPVSNSDTDSTSHLPASGDGSEDSIEVYMSSLLKRVRGEDEPKPSYEPSYEQPSSDADNPQSGQEPADEVMQASQFVPRRQAPEGDSHLAEMRKLANESARAAIKSSDKRRGVLVAKDRLLVASVASVIGVGLLVVTRSVFSPALYGAICCFGIAGWWGFQGFHVRKKLTQDKAGETTAPPDTPVESIE